MRPGPATRTAFAMRGSHGCPSPRFSASLAETFCNVPFSADSQQQRRIHTEVQSHPNRADRSQSRHARPFLRRPQRPGHPQRFHALGTFSSVSFDSALADPRATAAEPALRDHWQRDIHACSESTLSHPETLRNHNSRPRCANPVDVEDCLWKEAENGGEIRKCSVKDGSCRPRSTKKKRRDFSRPQFSRLTLNF